jgi:hypothetical protein
VRRAREDRGWFHYGVRLFAVALVLGVLVAVFAPVDFVRVLGAVALVCSTLGLLISHAGRRLEATTSTARNAGREAPVP